jgi:hypothetical protein
MIRAFQSLFSRSTDSKEVFPLELKTPERTPPNTPRSPDSAHEGSSAAPLDPLEHNEALIRLFRPIFSISGDAREKEGSVLKKYVFNVQSHKHQTVKTKTFLLHPACLDDSSLDASANPAIQIVADGVKCNKKGDPKFYVYLSPKNSESPFSQFKPQNLQIFDCAFRLGLTPKKYPLIESSSLLEPTENLSETKDALLLQFVNGGDLQNFLFDHPDLSFDQKLELAKQALFLVDKLHENRIAHLDLKPENFLVYIRDDGCTLKLTDFGFSRLENEGNDTTTDRCYSANYMPPEFAQSYWVGRGWKINGKFLPPDQKPLPVYKLDQWCIGATLFVIFFGISHESALKSNYKSHPIFPSLEFFIDYKQNLSNRMIDGYCASYAPKVARLLKGLLQYDPEKRIEVKQALSILIEE